MTIHLISTCSDPMLEGEFVRPISRIVADWTRNTGRTFETVIHHATNIPHGDFESGDKVIICGTAFQDDEYLKNIKSFQWLTDTTSMVLGICSGMQGLALAWEAELVLGLEIGMVKVDTLVDNALCQGSFSAYCLHRYGLKELDHFHVLARSQDSVQVIGHRTLPLFGVLFHPEVRQEGVITSFLEL